VCRALRLTRLHDGLDLTGSDLVIRPGRADARAGLGARIRCGPRVGIRHAAALPWRFWIAGEPAVSPLRGAAPGPYPRAETGSHRGLTGRGTRA
jgi:DNA-3-methyladenine glycosylase